MKGESKTRSDLPNDAGKLKALLREKDQRIAVLEEQLQLLMHKRFGASSEKASLDQFNLFNEAEATADHLSETPSTDDAETIVPEHKRKKTGRRRLPADLPRVVVDHDLPEDHKSVPAAATRSALAKRHRNNLILSRLKPRCCSMCVINTPAWIAKARKITARR
jgi:transposase